MPNYPFLIVNEQKIRDHFRKWLEFGKDAHPSSVAAEGYSKRLSIIQALDAESDIRKLMSDDIFCKQLVESLFNEDIVKIFGGYKRLLSLPSVTCDLTRKYVMLPVDFIPDSSVDIAITMDGSLRPLIVMRIVDQTNKENHCFICYHARYSLDLLPSYWLPGENSAHPILNLTRFRNFHLDDNFTMLHSLVVGETVTEDYISPDRQPLVIYCPFAEKQKVILDRAATKIQTAFRGHSIRTAYKSYRQSQKAIQEIAKALSEGRPQEGIELLAGGLPDRIKATSKKLKLL